MIPEIGQTFTVTYDPRIIRKTYTGTGKRKQDMWFIEWQTFEGATYRLIDRQVIDNDTDREFKLLNLTTGFMTEVEAKWFGSDTGRKINLVN